MTEITLLLPAYKSSWRDKYGTNYCHRVHVDFCKHTASEINRDPDRAAEVVFRDIKGVPHCQVIDENWIKP